MNGEHEEHELTAQSVGHVHAVNPEGTVSADIVRCACGAPPVIGIAVGWQKDREDHFGAAMLEPAVALSLANAILAAVGHVISTDDDRAEGAVAGLLTGVDMDAELAALLDRE
jgi:hypothetical protein